MPYSNLQTRQQPERPTPTALNDVHAKLNPTTVAEVVAVRSLDDVIAAVRRAKVENRPVSVAGGRHAMGGQQFVSNGLHLDMCGLDRVLAFDHERGRITVEAGIQWPALIAAYEARQPATGGWGIAQKQTGADRLSIGGAIAANIHGRGLTMRPFIDDVIAFDLVDAEGRLRHCTREHNAELFGLVFGGYGLFGVVVSATLQLVPRRTVQRDVEIRTTDGLMAAFEHRIEAGYTYGDFQFATDPESSDFLHAGVFSCYRPVADDAGATPAVQQSLSTEDWYRLTHLAHYDKRRAFHEYAGFYRGTSGQRYRSDTHQLALYMDDYHSAIDAAGTCGHPGSEMISEIYVPRHALESFLAAVRRDFRRHGVDLIYGTIRLIQTDRESLLAWADQPYACVIFNLHTEHSASGLARTRDDFVRLIDLAVAVGGKYYLTYHRYARADQLLTCYPQFPEFLAAKHRWDPQQRFQSEWFRHCCNMLSETAA